MPRHVTGPWGPNRKIVTYGKNKYQARKHKRGRGSTVHKNMVVLGKGLPKKIMVTHKYRESVTLSTVAGVIAFYQFSCNGMFDPNTTGTGHQPMYFDQLGALYDHYTVIGSKIIWKVVPYASGANTGMKMAVFINDDTTTTPTTVDMIAEETSGQLRLIPTGSNNTFTFNQKWSAKKAFGGSVMANDKLSGDTSANPTEQSYYQIALSGIGGQVDNVGVIVEVFIEYIAIWTELRDIAGS